MSVEFDVREHGVLFALVEEYNKALGFMFLVLGLFDKSLGVTLLQGQPREGAPPPVPPLEKQPNWPIWIFPKDRPKYMQAYWDLEGKLGYLGRLLAWPVSKYPLEVVPCEGGNDG